MDGINLEIITPEKTVYKDVINSITIPGTLGSFQVLKDHAPLISSFEVGVITVQKNGNKNYFSTSGGTVEVEKNKILVLADSVEKVDEIDVDRARQAKERAEQRLARKHEAEINESRAEAALKRAVNRINARLKYVKLI
jgi:F-type H+-transporting ATPase subunit epsilon